VREQERLGWRLGVEAYTFHKYTLFEAIDKTAQLGLSYIGGLSFQKVGAGIPGNFDEQLTDPQLETIRLKLDDAGLRLLTFYHHRIPSDEPGCRRIFEFGRKMGIETFIGEPAPEALPMLEKLCDEFQMNLALHNHGETESPHTWHPDRVLALCQGRSPRLGAAGDLGYWLRAGLDPVVALRTLKDRLITVQMHDLHAAGPEGHDVPWGTGVGKTAEFIREVRRLGLKPTLFGVEYSYDFETSMPQVAQCIEFFNRISLEEVR
jgi:sugar phosphate isomerase/epimerase